MSSLSTHVLDAVSGNPAAGLDVGLFKFDGEGWTSVGGGKTDVDGRIVAMGFPALEPGVYQIVFATADYFTATARKGFYPEVSICFEVDDERHYHVPLLLSPYGFSTYRGS